MYKSIFFSVVFLTCSGFTCYHAQNIQTELTKYDLFIYEFTFSDADYQKVLLNQEYVTNITMAKEVVFNDSSSTILVKTTKTLEKNIIYGKFKKQEVKLLTFVKL